MYFIAVALSFALCVPSLSPLVAVLKTRLAGDGHGQWRIPMVYNPFQCSWYKRNRKAMSLDSLAKNTPLWIALNDAAKKKPWSNMLFLLNGSTSHVQRPSGPGASLFMLSIYSGALVEQSCSRISFFHHVVPWRFFLVPRQSKVQRKVTPR